ncbi:SPOR domain-containing protein [Marinomonas sp. 2405UD68-3]|uniref:SPOR domain-containing protein n=1 Tax=Marinomonas sp. 2405UD68-3 TaxID=3391835 RepID=UPI0039C980FD
MASKSSASKKGATRKAKQPVKKAKPKIKWWLWLFVLCLAGAFIFGLSQLSKVQSSSTQIQVKTTPIAAETKKAAPTPEKTAQTKPKKTAPKKAEPQKDTFEFYQILQDSEVDTSHVDAYQSTPRGEQDFLYMIQAASFRSSSDSDRMRAKLILSGLDAKIRKTVGKDGRPWYRVILGPFESRSKMSRAQDKLVSLDIQSYTYRVKKEQ